MLFVIFAINLSTDCCFRVRMRFVEAPITSIQPSVESWVQFPSGASLVPVSTPTSATNVAFSVSTAMSPDGVWTTKCASPVEVRCIHAIQ